MGVGVRSGQADAAAATEISRLDCGCDGRSGQAGRHWEGLRRVWEVSLRTGGVITYASRAVMAGCGPSDACASLAHTNIQMTMRYVHPAEEHKREATSKIEKFKVVEAVKLAQKSLQGATNLATLGAIN